MSQTSNSDSIGLRTIDLNEMPDHTRHVLGAIYSLSKVDNRRTQKSDIRDRIDVNLSRDQLTYRLRRLREEDIVFKNTYQEHDIIRTEYQLETHERAADSHDSEDVVADARTCYGSVELLDEDEARDPSVSTMVALAGRVRDAEARLARLEEEVGIDTSIDDDDGRAGLADFV